MTASDEHFRRPDGRELFADGFGGNGTRMQVGVGVRTPCAAERDEGGFWYARSQACQGVAGFGDGLTREVVLDDLRAGLAALLSVARPQS